MRVFDSYTYNVIDKVKFNKTKAYIDNMLAELGLSYQNIGFKLQCGPMSQAIEKYPALSKYYHLEDENASEGQLYTNQLLTSFSKNWHKGELYVEEEDQEVIGELFSKIPRPYRFAFCKLLLDGIDWYGEGDLAPAIQTYDSYQVKYPTGSYQPFDCNGISLSREYDDGNKVNTVCVVVEATAETVPKDTTDILKKLEPYLGTPIRTGRRCMFSKEEYERFDELEKKYNKRLIELFEEMVGECQYTYKDIPNEPIILELCSKKTINKAFKGSGFEMGNRKGMLPGMNAVVCKDLHNYNYYVLFDRSPSGNWFSFNLGISGYNFKVALSQKNFGAKSKEEAEQKIEEIAKYIISVRNVIGEEMAADFGDTPDWY